MTQYNQSIRGNTVEHKRSPGSAAGALVIVEFFERCAPEVRAYFLHSMLRLLSPIDLRPNFADEIIV
jgi:hypothetical protein